VIFNLSDQTTSALSGFGQDFLLKNFQNHKKSFFNQEITRKKTSFPLQVSRLNFKKSFLRKNSKVSIQMTLCLFSFPFFLLENSSLISESSKQNKKNFLSFPINFELDQEPLKRKVEYLLKKVS